jgi:Ankyrin repeats (3 copies)
MSALRQPQVFSFDAATLELWRAAESGDLNELVAILARDVDVNARNEHGMTALMRAANNGHAAVVRALLERGADPNIARNDKFTALALAAFFGHTETVRILIEHGAKTEVVTRAGTSPRMWATARTFTEAARCFEKPAHAPAPMPAPAPARPVAIPAPVIRTLSDPPEIWDVVHEAPRGFDARSAFLSRIKSMRRPVAVGVFAGLLFAISCGVTAFVFRSSQASNLPAELPPVPTMAEVPVAPPPVERPVTEAAATNVDNPLAAHVVHKSPVMRQSRQRAVVADTVVEVAPSREEAPVAVPEIEKPKPREVVKSSPPNTALSPHLIAPAKTAAPKGKVIQWP